MTRGRLRLGHAAVAALTAVLVLCGCTSAHEEPGLFRSRPSAPAPTTTGVAAPEPTNRRLPVLGEQLWTTGDGLAITVRFAVHAVRRMPGATILDWSVTPLPSGDFAIGDQVPSSVDLGLDRDDDGDQRIYLFDDSGKVYRPLAHASAAVFHHCLCTPLWLAKLHLRIGDTRLLQLAFAPVPDSDDHVDVSLANLMPFWRVPVMAEGTVPLAMRSVDLARPAGPAPASSDDLPFTESDDRGTRRRSLRFLGLQTGPSGTALAWAVSSLDQPPFPAFSFGAPPVSATYPPTARLRTANVASGPELSVRVPGGGSRLLRARWITTAEPVPGDLECACSHFGLWARDLRTVGGTVTVSTTYARVPAGTRFADVVLPGLGTITNVAVEEPPIDADRAILGVGRIIAGTWTYDVSDPPSGWPTSAWPTPLPDRGELRDYRARVDRLVDLPSP